MSLYRGFVIECRLTAFVMWVQTCSCLLIHRKRCVASAPGTTQHGYVRRLELTSSSRYFFVELEGLADFYVLFNLLNPTGYVMHQHV
jgi:hypothetical protein